MKNNFIQAAAISVFVIAGVTSLWFYMHSHNATKTTNEMQKTTDSLCIATDSVNAMCCDSAAVDTAFTNH